MNRHRIAVVALAAACMAGMAACSRTHTPTDEQLTQLLRAERAKPDDPRAPLDGSAVNCLRAWSGDIELSGALPPSSSDEAAKTTCRQRLDGWLADATRNPDKLKFEDVSAPPSVRRAMALLADHRAFPAAMTRPPAPSQRPPVAPMPPAAPAAAEPADLNDALTAVNELDTLCQKAKQAASGDPSQASRTAHNIARYASYCDQRIEQMRTRISSLQQNGNPQQVAMMVKNAQRTLAVARQIAAQADAQNATP